MKEKVIDFLVQLIAYVGEHAIFLSSFISLAFGDVALAAGLIIAAFYFKLSELGDAIQIREVSVYPVLNVQLEKKEVTE